MSPQTPLLRAWSQILKAFLRRGNSQNVFSPGPLKEADHFYSQVVRPRSPIADPLGPGAQVHQGIGGIT